MLLCLFCLSSFLLFVIVLVLLLLSALCQCPCALSLSYLSFIPVCFAHTLFLSTSVSLSLSSLPLLLLFSLSSSSSLFLTPPLSIFPLSWAVCDCNVAEENTLCQLESDRWAGSGVRGWEHRINPHTHFISAWGDVLNGRSTAIHVHTHTTKTHMLTNNKCPYGRHETKH